MAFAAAAIVLRRTRLLRREGHTLYRHTPHCAPCGRLCGVTEMASLPGCIPQWSYTKFPITVSKETHSSITRLNGIQRCIPTEQCNSFKWRPRRGHILLTPHKAIGRGARLTCHEAQSLPTAEQSGCNRCKKISLNSSPPVYRSTPRYSWATGARGSSSRRRSRRWPLLPSEDPASC